MTMDIQKSRETTTPELKMTSPKLAEESRTIHYSEPKTIKRSFDVAFLMLPDEKLKQRQLEKQQRIHESVYQQKPIEMTKYMELPQITVRQDFNRMYEKSNSDREFVDNVRQSNNIDHIRLNRYALQNRHKIDETIARSNLLTAENSPIRLDVDTQPVEKNVTIREQTPPPERMQKSAFTKVSYNSGKFEPVSGGSPAPSTSPDHLSCPGSLSPPAVPPSPPVLNYIPKTPTYPMISPILRNTAMPGYPMMDGSYHNTSENPYLKSNSNFSNMKSDSQAFQNSKFQSILSYRPDMTPYMTPHPYQFQPQNFSSQNPDLLKYTNNGPQQEPAIMRNPAAAAILSSLLPTTFQSFSLPAQNVCAKCNISFRMTSDLVYHMRSHHKSEVQNDMSRRRREEKLKCPVCCESFRERHHLTRHMTAHQDKEGDILDTEQNCEFSSKKTRYGFQNGGGK